MEGIVQYWDMLVAEYGLVYAEVLLAEAKAAIVAGCTNGDMADASCQLYLYLKK